MEKARMCGKKGNMYNCGRENKEDAYGGHILRTVLHPLPIFVYFLLLFVSSWKDMNQMNRHTVHNAVKRFVDFPTSDQDV